MQVPNEGTSRNLDASPNVKRLGISMEDEPEHPSSTSHHHADVDLDVDHPGGGQGGGGTAGLENDMDATGADVGLDRDVDLDPDGDVDLDPEADVDLEGDIDLDADVQYYKNFHPKHAIPSFERKGTLAVTSFALSSFQDPISRKERIKEMWDANTEYIVRSLASMSLRYLASSR